RVVPRSEPLRFVAVRPARLSLLRRLVHFDAGIEESNDPTAIVPGNVPTRLPDAPALRALHDPLVPVLFARPQFPRGTSADDGRTGVRRRDSRTYLNIAGPDFPFEATWGDSRRA